MRPIKFRVFVKNDNHTRDGLYFIDLKDEVSEFDCRIMQEYELMQFTGLLDKNGKEIYEGDILQWDEKHTAEWDKHRDFLHTYQCVFDVGSFFLRSLDKYPRHESKFWHHITQDCEIIGNIYEHPYLLTK